MNPLFKKAWNTMDDRYDNIRKRPAGGNGNSLKEDDAVDQGKMLYDGMIAYVKDVYDAARTGRNIDPEGGIDFIRQLAGSHEIRGRLFAMALHLENDSGYIYQHPVNVAILSVILAQNLGFEMQDAVKLGSAALFHDIGSVKIPENILNKASRLSNAEYVLLKQRPNYSFEILETLKQGSPYLAETAVQVYERIDGSGYPLGVQKDEINEYARIIGLVDVYEALIHARPHRERLLHFPAVKEIIKLYKNSFQRQFLKALLNTVSIFPVFSYVRLNSGAIGRVIDIHPEQPLRPKIQVVFDSQGRRVLMDRIIDLADNPLLHIISSVGEDEIQATTTF